MSLALGVPAGELAHRITRKELADWAAFEQTFGPITIQERVDAASAVTAWAIARLSGSDSDSPNDFMPHWSSGSAPTKPEQTDEELIAYMRALKRRKRKRKGKRKRE